VKKQTALQSFFGSYRRQERAREAFDTLLALVLLALCLMPFYIMITLPMKGGLEQAYHFWAWPKNFSLMPFWRSVRSYSGSLVRTGKYVGGAMVITLVCSMVSGYVFARMQFAGKEYLYISVLFFLMVPSVLTLSPLFNMVKDLGLYNTGWALILPWSAMGQVWGIPLVRSHIEGLPQDLFDSAKIDGAGELACVRHIALPLCLPILATVTVLKATDFYSDFIWPLMVIFTSDKQVVMYQLYYDGGTYFGFAAASLPLLILFLFTSRFYMQGLTSGAIKQ